MINILMESENSSSEEAKGKHLAWWGSIAGVCLMITLGSIFITRSYLERQRYERENWRPPYLGRLEDDLPAVNRTGEKVSLGQLRNKVYVVGYQYTDCPAGCLGLAAVMKSLERDFGSEPQFQLVSISVNPEGDTPEKMDAWVKKKGVDEANWWFLTGNPEAFTRYMLQQFKLYSTEKITDPAMKAAQGEFAHDQRLVIVDGAANIRGYYDVMNVQYGQHEIDRLRRDLKLVLHPELKLSDVQAVEPPTP